jgi:hypothetical protein
MERTIVNNLQQDNDMHLSAFSKEDNFLSTMKHNDNAHKQMLDNLREVIYI